MKHEDDTFQENQVNNTILSEKQKANLAMSTVNKQVGATPSEGRLCNVCALLFIGSTHHFKSSTKAKYASLLQEIEHQYGPTGEYVMRELMTLFPDENSIRLLREEGSASMPFTCFLFLEKYPVFPILGAAPSADACTQHKKDLVLYRYWTGIYFVLHQICKKLVLLLVECEEKPYHSVVKAESYGAFKRALRLEFGSIEDASSALADELRGFDLAAAANSSNASPASSPNKRNRLDFTSDDDGPQQSKDSTAMACLYCEHPHPSKPCNRVHCVHCHKQHYPACKQCKPCGKPHKKGDGTTKSCMY